MFPVQTLVETITGRRWKLGAVTIINTMLASQYIHAMYDCDSAYKSCDHRHKVDTNEQVHMMTDTKLQSSNVNTMQNHQQETDILFVVEKCTVRYIIHVKL